MAAEWVPYASLALAGVAAVPSFVELQQKRTERADTARASEERIARLERALAALDERGSGDDRADPPARPPAPAAPPVHTAAPGPVLLPGQGDGVVISVEGDRCVLARPITYVDGDEEIVIPAGPVDLHTPRGLSWLFTGVGRHTLPIVLHQHLVSGLRPGDTDGRREADFVFLRALEASGVPAVARNLLYAAVTLTTRYKSGGWARFGIWLWAAGVSCALVAVVAGIVSGSTWLVVAAAPAPVYLALLWGSQALAGVTAGAFWPVAVLPVAGSYLGFLVYRLLESAVWMIRSVFGPRSAVPLPEPIGYPDRRPTSPP